VIETPMSLHLSVQQFVGLLVIVLIIIAGPYLRRLGGVDPNLARLQAELQRLPVYSAETIHHKEAEFIRDKLPKRFPIALVLALCVLFAVVAWWLWLNVDHA
jgi:hypothetical protein